jgi:hypothetical protein
MGEPLENLYFNWLCAKIIDATDSDRTATYWNLLSKLHHTEFVWMMVGDEHRAEDGKELRRDFIFQAEIPDDVHWRTVIGCSILEMLVAFAKRAEFQDATPVPEWFWEFLTNLGLEKFSDQAGFDPEYVELVLDQLIWRTYEPNGNGGLFPIKNPTQDQREVEIWYQFCEYLVDQNRVP